MTTERWDQAGLTRYITETFAGVEVQVHPQTGDSFFFLGAERMFPFATIVTRDEAHDAYSRLDREGVVRLNIGLQPESFKFLFGAPPEAPATSGIDYAALDRLFPHPIYAKQRWASVVNPGPVTWPTVQALLAEAYELAVEKAKKKAPGQPPT